MFSRKLGGAIGLSMRRSGEETRESEREEFVCLFRRNKRAGKCYHFPVSRFFGRKKVARF
jgi:hypothetical protein